LEEEQAISFIRRFHEETGQIPSVRRICRETDLTVPRFYRMFGSLENLVEKAGLKLDKETKERIKSTRKASRKRVRKSRRKTNPRDSPSPIVESVEQPATSIFEELQENLQTEEEARKSRLENIGRFAGQIEILALNDNPEISQPVLDALYNIVPTILEQKHNVTMTIKDLLEADQLLHQVRKREKRLLQKQKEFASEATKLELEKIQVRKEWENIKKERKRDPGKAALQVRVNELEQNEKVLQDMLNEVYVRDKNFRVIANTFLFSISQCEKCRTFAINSLKLHPQVLEWFLEQKWLTLSFDTLDASRLGCQT